MKNMLIIFAFVVLGILLIWQLREDESDKFIGITFPYGNDNLMDSEIVGRFGTVEECMKATEAALLKSDVLGSNSDYQCSLTENEKYLSWTPTTKPTP